MGRDDTIGAMSDEILTTRRRRHRHRHPQPSRPAQRHERRHADRARAAIDELDGRRDVRVVVVRGAGPAFCAGMDLREMESRGGARRPGGRRGGGAPARGALAASDHRAGPRRRHRGRLRAGAALRPARDGGDRAHRHAAGAHRHGRALPARPEAGGDHRPRPHAPAPVHRPAHRRPRGPTRSAWCTRWRRPPRSSPPTHALARTHRRQRAAVAGRHEGGRPARASAARPSSPTTTSTRWRCAPARAPTPARAGAPCSRSASPSSAASEPRHRRRRESPMKLVRYGRPGQEKPGLIDADGALRDLSRVVKDITPDVLAPAGLKRLRGANVAAPARSCAGGRAWAARWPGSARWSASASTTPTTRPRWAWPCPRSPPSSSRPRAPCAGRTTRPCGRAAASSSTTRSSWPR